MTEHALFPGSLPPAFAPVLRSRSGWDSDALPAPESILLRASLAREADLLKQNELLLQQHQILRREADHRLTNGLQMVISLLSLQSRAADVPAVAEQLTAAAHRVAAIERVHRRLHDLDGMRTVAFKAYLEELCRDVAGLVAQDEREERSVSVECVPLNLPTATAIPLSFIANELITNAAKHGKGQIRLRLEPIDDRYRMTVSNDGPVMPASFDPASSRGMGMKLIHSFARQIGGTVTFRPGDDGTGMSCSIEFAIDTPGPQDKLREADPHDGDEEQNERLRRACAARALCARAGFDAAVPFRGRPTWTWYLDYVYVVLRAMGAHPSSEHPPPHALPAAEPPTDQSVSSSSA